MPSLLDHLRELRRRATNTPSSSNRTPKSTLSPLSPLSPVEPQTPSLSLEISPSSRTSEHLIDRRIHPDIDSLLTSPDDEPATSTEKPVSSHTQSPRRIFYGLGGLSPSRPRRNVAKRASQSSQPRTETIEENYDYDYPYQEQGRQFSLQPSRSRDVSSEYQRFPSIDSPERSSTFGRHQSRWNRLTQSGDFSERNKSFHSHSYSELSISLTHSRSQSSGGFFGRKLKKRDSNVSRPSSARSANTFFNPQLSQPVAGPSSRQRSASAASQISPNSGTDSASKFAASIRSSSAKWSADVRLEDSNVNGSSENTGSSNSHRQANASSLLLPVANDSPSSSRLPFTPPTSHRFDVDSPQTFGQHTPAHRSAPDLLYADSPPLPPPLPPPPTTSHSFVRTSNLNDNNLSPFSSPSLSPSSSQNVLKESGHAEGDAGKGHPSRHPQRENVESIPRATLSSTTFGNLSPSQSGSSSFPSLSFTFGSPFPHSSLTSSNFQVFSNTNSGSNTQQQQQQVYRYPKASNIFSLSTTQLGEQREEYNLTRIRQREGSMSATGLTLNQTSNDNKRRAVHQEDRRESAKWSAQQATEGAVVEPPHRYGWPAIVSREMVKLSLDDKLKTRGIQGSEAGDAESPRGAHVWRALRKKSHQHSSSDSSKAHSHLSSVPPPPSSSITSPTTLAASPALLLPAAATRSFGERFDSPYGYRKIASQYKTEGISTSEGGLLPAPRRSRSLGDNHHVVVRNSGIKSAGQDSRTQSVSKGTAEVLSAQRRRSRVSIAGENGPTTRHSSIRKRVPSASLAPQRQPSSILLKPSNVAVTAPTPEASPIGRPTNQNSDDGDSTALQIPSVNVTPPRSDKSSGKRKAEESEGESPPRQKISQKVTTFAVQEDRGTPRVSNSSHAPSSFNSYGRKRPRMSSSPMTTPDRSNPGSVHEHRTPSRTSNRANVSTPHPPSRPGSYQDTSIISSGEGGASASQKRQSRHHHQNSRDHSTTQRRQSLSQYSGASIPISAILSPHAPSIDRLSTFHMRDPRKPPPKRAVGWTLRLPYAGEPGSPLHAWCFWIGFMFPPLWWLAAFWRIPETRIVGGDTEKAVTVDDPQIERDARTWRTRCRILSVVFFFTYAPVIILLAIFAPR